jgi:hypothetical protein
MIRISSRCFSVSFFMKRSLFRGAALRSDVGVDHRHSRPGGMSSIIELIASNMRAVNSVSGAASCQLVGNRAQRLEPKCHPQSACSTERPLMCAFLPYRVTNWNGSIGEGFWTPALCDGGGEAPGPASESLPRRKPRGGRALEGATYGDLRVADGAPGSVLKRRGEDCVDRKDDGELVRSCRCEA